MRINMDFQQRVLIDTNAQDWVETRANGVRRRMLDRDGAEDGRATTIVSFAPDSYFPPHTHTGGEEFLVLEGTFSDNTGDFNAGMYVRNPIGTRHTPFTKDGCTIFMKLCQMDATDQALVRIDTALESNWQQGSVAGMSVLPLHEFGNERVGMVCWQPGHGYSPDGHLVDGQLVDEHPGGEEILILDGALEDEHGRYPAGTWLRMPTGSSHTPFSTDGCTLFFKAGHLAGL